jgi:3-hydroxyisobutyrate dehydrogenase-like beta-hydroxyacid dehydrogenase
MLTEDCHSILKVLHKQGIQVTGYDVYSGSLQRFADVGARTSASAAEACRDANVVVLMVVNAEQAEEVLFDKGVAEGEPCARVSSKRVSLRVDVILSLLYS